MFDMCYIYENKSIIIPDSDEGIVTVRCNGLSITNGDDYDIYKLGDGKAVLLIRPSNTIRTGDTIRVVSYPKVQEFPGKTTVDADKVGPRIQSTILEEAKEIIYGDREKTYGAPGKNLTAISKIWESILGIDITPDQVCLCMIGVKLARLIHQIDHHDSQVDICGYAALLERIQNLEVDKPKTNSPQENGYD